MWIKLTKAGELPILINLSKVGEITPSVTGGSIFHLDEKFTGTAKRLTVIEPITTVAQMIGIPSSLRRLSRSGPPVVERPQLQTNGYEVT